MAGYYVVRPGDCLSSIAKAKGFASYETIWKRPENDEVRAKRKDPNVLHPGDRIFVPDIAMKVETRSTDQRHKFVLQKPSTLLEIRVLRDGVPVSDTRYTLQIGEALFKGMTDGSGLIRHQIEPNSLAGRLHMDDPALDWELKIGDLDPATEPRGIQQRLNNLGFLCGDADGSIGPRTRAALRLFQKRFGLEPTGRAGADTIQKLLASHDGV